jgi:hypothetical protein
MTAASPSEDGDGGVLEEVVVGANYGAVATASASRAVADACSSLRRRAMVHTWIRVLAAFFSMT